MAQPYRDVAAENKALETPDKANAFFIAGQNLPLGDEDPDYPALVLGNYMLGGGFLNSRLAVRIRQKDGLSYGVGSQFQASPLDKAGAFTTFAIYAPQNEAKLEAAFKEEIARVLKDGFEAKEIAEAKSGWLQSRQVSRAQDAPLARTLATDLYIKRTLAWDAALEKKVEALTGEQILAAMRKYLDPAKMTIVKAGDFAKGAAAAPPGSHETARRPRNNSAGGPAGGRSARRGPRAARPAKGAPHANAARRDADGRLLLDAREGQPEGPRLPRGRERLHRGVHEADGGFQKALYDEMLGRIKETDLSVPYRDGGWFYYSRTEKGQQYPIYCRKKGSVEAPEEVYLDVNVLAKGEKFMAVGARSVSDGGNLLAYTTDNTGFRDYTLHVKDLATGKLFPETVARASSVAWAADNKTLFYTVTDMAKRPYRLYRHTLGADPSTDVLLHEEKDEMFRVFTGRSRSRAVIFVGLGSLTSNEWYWIPAGEPTVEAAPDFRAREGPRVRRGSPRRPLLHPIQQGLPQLPRRHGAHGRTRPGELEGDDALPRRRHDRGRQPLRRLRRVFRARGRAAATARHEPRVRRLVPHRLPGGHLRRLHHEQLRVRRPDSSATATSPTRRRRRSTTSTWRRSRASS